MEVFFDSRWVGDHGIGRFARMLKLRLSLQDLSIGRSPSSPFDPLRMTAAMLRLRSDSGVLSPGYNAPLFVSRPFIFTIHDLNHIERPENSSALKRAYYRFIVRRACRKAFRVLTVSEYSRWLIIAWAGVEPNHVVNVGNGVEQCYRPDGAAYAPGFSYLLCVSNRKAHKNEPRVVEAFSQAEIDPRIRLLFTGAPSKELSALCSQFHLGERVIFVGRVPETELPGLYRGALALVFPSLYEGFGLPVIEAMACGTPVLTSDTTSLPEIAGDAALMVNPLSVNEITAGIERLCRDPDLREHLREKGYGRVKQFCWDDVAFKVRVVLDEMTRATQCH